MIIEFEPNTVLACVPPKYNVYYKMENEFEFKKLVMTYTQLINFLNIYGIETNNINELIKFGVDVANIKVNSKL